MLTLLLAPPAFAASTSDLSVKGSITPSACEPLISGGRGRLRQNFGRFAQCRPIHPLPNQSLHLSVRCEGSDFSPSTPSITAPAHQPTTITGMAWV
jgi:hypothetical protein